MNESRRHFFMAASKTACAPSLLGTFTALESALSAQEGLRLPFLSLSADAIQKFADDLQSKSDSKSIIDSKQLPFLMRMFSEQATAGKEFEFHEHTDHIFRIVEGATRFDVGGTAEHPHRVKLGEWLAPGSRGSTSIEMSKGDMLIIPRGIPHKRTTKGNVVLLLTSITGLT
jgi:mannose-6-phosphate isomerase-like protein (cupin superfamily)